MLLTIRLAHPPTDHVVISWWVIRLSTFVDSLLKYIQQSEKLIVVTLTLFLAGLALYAAEDRLFDYGGLPAWARPLGLIVWTICAAHVAIRSVMALASGSTAAVRFIAGIPQRRRQTAYNRPLINRLLATGGIAREMLCYALRQDDNHLWVSSDRTVPRWLTKLRRDGLLYLSGSDWGTTHFRIHPVAWEYMQKYPNKFINRLRWRSWPWTIDFDEDKAAEQIEELNPKSRLERFWEWLTGRRRKKDD